jgi:non-heme chloroperoxidase
MKKQILLSMTVATMLALPVAAQLIVSESDHYTVWEVEPSEHQVKRIKLSTGVELEYVEQGQAAGIPVILLHGITDSWHSFEPVLPYLPINLHVFAISQRGHGDSEKPMTGYEMKDFSNDLAAFLEQFKLGPAFIVGHSMSGLVVQQFVLDHPSLVRGIVIVDSKAAFHDDEGMREFVSSVMELKDPVPRSFADAFQKSTLARPIDPAYYETVVNEGLKPPARVWQAAFSGIMNADYAAQLKDISKPTLILWGDQDAFCSRSSQFELTNGIRNSRLVIYEGTGHALHWEQPARFAEDLRSFIQRAIVFEKN